MPELISHETGRSYPAIALEVAGPTAMFTRPDTGVTPISYPVPTYSAAKGMFEAILRRTNIYIQPTRVEICKPIRYERYVTNYGGPLRGSAKISGKNNYQLIATILVDVLYRIYAVVKEKKRSGQRKMDYAGKFKEEFDRRLENGQTFYTPCLGWKEFVPSYVGPFRLETKPDENVKMTIPSLLYSMWERRRLRPTFQQTVEVEAGVMFYE